MTQDYGIRGFNPDEIRALTAKLGMRPAREKPAVRPEDTQRDLRIVWLKDKIAKLQAELKKLEQK